MATSQFKQLLFSQYITSGAQVSIGVGAVVLGLGATFGIPVAATAASGAICVSIVDLPGPVRLKALQLFAAALATTLVTLFVSYARLNPWSELAAIFIFSMLGAMLNAFGKKALALSFVVLFALVVGVGSPPSPGLELEHALRFGAGAFLYACYGLIMCWLLRYRTKQQILAEAAFELSRYLEAKAAFFERDADLNQCYGALVAEQVNLVDKQQAARDIVFRQVSNAKHVRLASILIGTLDISERIFSSHTDYGLIHGEFGSADVTMFIRDLANKAALDLRRIGYAILRSREAPHAVIYKAEIIAIEHELFRLAQDDLSAAQGEALEGLNGVYARLRAAIDLIADLHRIVRAKPAETHLPADLALLPFLSNLSFSPRVVIGELKWESPVLRFAIRLTLAMATGYALSQFLPYATHSYWILLTVAVILRANYSVTRQRRNDRILGTLVGCLFIAMLLYFRPGYAAEVVVMLIALGVAHTFATFAYRYTAAAACVMAVLQVHFINPGAPFAISERLIDTLVGAALAFAFSFVLPSWEHLSMKRMVRDLMRAHARYALAVVSLDAPDAQYRLARKQLFDTIALTSAAFRRMLLEPRGQQRAVSQLNDFITTSYTFASHMAALRMLLDTGRDGMTDELGQRLVQVSTAIANTFAPAIESGEAPPHHPSFDEEQAQIEERASEHSDDLHVSLLRTLDLIMTQARRLVVLAASIGPAAQKSQRRGVLREPEALV